MIITKELRTSENFPLFTDYFRSTYEYLRNTDPSRRRVRSEDPGEEPYGSPPTNLDLLWRFVSESFTSDDDVTVVDPTTILFVCDCCCLNLNWVLDLHLRPLDVNKKKKKKENWFKEGHCDYEWLQTLDMGISGRSVWGVKVYSFNSESQWLGKLPLRLYLCLEEWWGSGSRKDGVYQRRLQVTCHTRKILGYDISVFILRSINT